MAIATDTRPGEDERFDPATRSRGLIATGAWTILCLLLFVWWASRYRSVVERLGEWQFATFDRYYPSLTAVLAVLVLAAPVALVVWFVRNRQRRKAEQDDRLSARDHVLIAINGALRGRIFFLIIAGVTGVCALAAALSLLALPATTGESAIITGGESSWVREGPARYAAGRTIGRVARLEENVGLARRVTYVAPVRLSANRIGPVVYFTEVERLAGPTPRFVPLRDGVLYANGLPRELIHLYRNVQVQTVDKPYLLVRDASWLRWRPIVLAVQLALVALVSLLVAGLLRRQADRLDRIMNREVN